MQMYVIIFTIIMLSVNFFCNISSYQGRNQDLWLGGGGGGGGA